MPNAERATKVLTSTSSLPSCLAPPSSYSLKLTPSLKFWKVPILTTWPPHQGPHTRLYPLPPSFTTHGNTFSFPTCHTPHSCSYNVLYFSEASASMEFKWFFFYICLPTRP